MSFNIFLIMINKFKFISLIVIYLGSFNRFSFKIKFIIIQTISLYFIRLYNLYQKI